MTNKAVEMYIRSCIQKMSPDEVFIFQKNRKAYSDTRWAYKEMLRLVVSNPDAMACYTIELFVSRMERYSYLNPVTSQTFSIAHDVGLDVLDTIKYTKK